MKQILSEQFFRMQKLAGILTENQENDILAQKEFLSVLQKKIKDPNIIKKAEKLANNLSDEEKQKVIDTAKSLIPTGDLSSQLNEFLTEEIDLTDITNKILASPGAADKLEKLSNNLTELNFNLEENDGIGGFATLAIFGIAGGLSTWMGVAGYAIIASNPIFATAAISAALIACVAATLVTYSSDGSPHSGDEPRELKPEKWEAIPVDEYGEPAKYNYRLAYMYSNKPEYQIFLEEEPKQKDYISFLKIAPKPMEIGDGIMVLDKENKKIDSYKLTQSTIGLLSPYNGAV